MLKHKNFERKWLFNHNLSCCPHTDILSLYYIENEGMFCTLSQSLNGMHPQSKLTAWNKERNIRYRPKTICGHFIKVKDVKETTHKKSI